MCLRRRKRDEKIQTGQEVNKNGGCARRCRQWFCKKIGRFIKKKVFRVPDTHYDILGTSLGSIKDKIKELGKPMKKKIKLFNLTEKDIKLLQGMKEKKLKKKFEISISNYNILNNMLKDYKAGELSLPDLVKKQKALDKMRLHQILEKYNEEKKKIHLMEIKAMSKLKISKLDLKAIDPKVLNNVIGDLKKIISQEGDQVKVRLDSIVPKSEMKHLLSVLEVPDLNLRVSKSRILSLVKDIEKIRSSK